MFEGTGKNLWYEFEVCFFIYLKVASKISAPEVSVYTVMSCNRRL